MSGGERAFWAVLLGVGLLLGSVQAWKAQHFDPRPQARCAAGWCDAGR